MARSRLEERVAALEKQVAELQTAINSSQKKDWRSMIGIFSGDEVMRQINEEALKYREADRERARRRYAKKPRAKK